MTRKFSELTPSEQAHFQGMADFMKETWNEDINVKLSVVKKFDLDIKDPVVFEFLTDVHVSEPAPRSRTDFPHDKALSTSPSQIAEPLPPTPPATTTTVQPVGKSKKREMTYANSEDLIIIQNRLLHAISHLTLNERRLILFLSPIIRKQLSINPNNKKFIIRVEDFMSEYKLKGGGYYPELEKTTISIQRKVIEFWNYGNNGKPISTVRLGWVTKGEYFKDEGCIELQFHDDVIEMLTVFDANTGNFWSQYKKEWITKLGTYGIIMLELVLSSFELNLPENKDRTNGYYTVEHLREKFDCVDDYPRFSNFKRYVIDKAIQEIHANTPLKISYEIIKVGRVAKGIRFSYIDASINVKAVKGASKDDNNTPKENNPFINFKMSQKQLSMFAAKIKKATGQDIDEIVSELCNVHLQGRHVDFLKVLDFVPSDWYSNDEIKDHPNAEKIQKIKQEQLSDCKAEQARLRRDFELLLANAKEFVLANQKRIGIGVEKMYFDKGDYHSIVSLWELYLLDKNQRRMFAMIDEILERYS